MSHEPTPKQRNEDLLRRSILAAREALRARAAQRPAPLDDAAPPATRAATLMNSVANVLPLAARMALDAARRVYNPKILAADLKKYARRSFDAGKWLRLVREIAKRRTRGDPSEVAILVVARELVSASRQTPGMAQASHNLLGGCARLSSETVRTVVRYLENHGAVDTLNVLCRKGRRLLRDANAYVLRLPDAPPAAAEPVRPSADAPVAELGPLARASAALARCAPLFVGLVARAWGLNATPMPSRYLRSEHPPAPA